MNKYGITITIAPETHEILRNEAFKRRVTMRQAAKEAFELWSASSTLKPVNITKPQPLP